MAVAADPALPPQFTHREILQVLSGVLLGLLLAALDQTVVVTALPAIARELNGLPHLSWIVTAYLLSATASTPIYGKLSDLYGRRRMLKIGIVIFVLTSVFCAMSASMGQLILARLLQGIGGGALISMSQTIIADVISPRERGRYQVYMVSVWGFASLGGPVFGGFFVEYLSWRWVFWINLPIGIIAFVLCTLALRRLPGRRAGYTRIDYLGAGIFVPAVVALLLAMSWGGTEFPWSSPVIIGLIVGGFLLAVAFGLQELRAVEPLLPPRLLFNVVILFSNLIAFVASAALFGATVLMPVFFQFVLGVGPADTGMLLIPLLGSSTVAAFATGQWMRRTGRYKKIPMIGMICTTIGFGLLATAGTHTPLWLVTFYTLMIGLGMGGINPPTLIATQNAAEPRDIGAATASVSFFRSLGGSFGAAILWTVLLVMITSSLGGAGVESADLNALLLRGDVAQLSPTLRATLVPALEHAFTVAFSAGAAIMAIGVILVALWKEIPLRTTIGSASPKQADSFEAGH